MALLASEGITLISCDGERFALSGYGTQLSSFVKSFVEENPNETELQMPIVNASLLKKIIDFIDHHESEPMNSLPKPLSGNNLSSFVQAYYASFVDGFTNQELAEMTQAANFIGVNPLIQLCAAKIASYIRFKSPAEIRTNLGLSTNFTAEQAEKVAKENAWAKDL